MIRLQHIAIAHIDNQKSGIILAIIDNNMHLSLLFKYIINHPTHFESGACVLHGYSDLGFSVHDKASRKLVIVDQNGCTICPPERKKNCVHTHCTNSLAFNPHVMKNLRGYTGILNTNSGY